LDEKEIELRSLKQLADEHVATEGKLKKGITVRRFR